MGELLSYSIGSGLVLLAMFLVFRLTLAGEKQHDYNRGIILSIYAIAFLAMPLMHFVKSLFHKAAPTVLPDFTVMVTSVGVSEYHAPMWGTFLIWIYIVGMAVMIAKTVITWVHILKVVAHGEKVRKDGYTLVLTDDEKLSPFSWIRYVVMSRRDYEQCGETITAHELRHIGLLHWIDLLVAQAVIIINWFNPAAWLMHEDLMLIHEYQADMAVIDSGHNAKEYQMLLIKKAVGARFPSLANSLNHSKLKKRITMMYQEKSGKGRRLRALALVPAIAVALAATSIPQVQAAMSTIANSATSVGKVTDNSANPQMPTAPIAQEADTIKVIGYGTMKKINYADLTPETLKSKIIILNGKVISYDELSGINPDEISSVTLSADGKKILLTTKGLLIREGADAVSPKIIVDGKEIPQEELNNISPSDIESIQVFKDENTIVITLKK